MSKFLLFTISCLFISHAWADMFCPNNFNSVTMGDSLDTVQAACGKADNVKTYKKEPIVPQEWVYYVVSYPGMPGTLKTTVAFDDKGKVINISVNGAGLSETQICDNVTTIQFGDTQERIKKVCGPPATITKTTIAGPKPTEITELKYNSDPPVTLTFENGKLTDRKEN